MKNIPKGHHEVIRQYPWLRLEAGKKHVKVRHPETGDFINVAGTPGDYRAVKNFAADIRRLATTGQGFIHRNKGDTTA